MTSDMFGIKVGDRVGPVSPFQGLENFWIVAPGLCPGLPNGLSALDPVRFRRNNVIIEPA